METFDVFELVEGGVVEVEDEGVGVVGVGTGTRVVPGSTVLAIMGSCFFDGLSAVSTVFLEFAGVLGHGMERVVE